MTTNKARCRATTKSGDRCRGVATYGDFCTFHAPELKDRRREGRAKGGMKTLGKLKGDTKDGAVEDRVSTLKPWRGTAGDVKVLDSPDPAELLNLLADTIDEVRAGEISPQVANSVGYLAGVMVKVIEVHQMNERLQSLEKALGVK